MAISGPKKTNRIKDAKALIETVLRLEPQTAAFDCDGTLWSGDAGEGFLKWELDRKLVSDDVVRRMRARYAQYEAGKVPEAEMCGEMVTMHAGLFNSDVARAAEQFFINDIDTGIFPEMRELLANLRFRRCDVWLVSSSADWLIQAGARRFGVAPDHVLATTVAVEKGKATDKLIRVPNAAGKSDALKEHLKEPVDVAFGNSKWDVEMLASARQAFVINPTAELVQLADQRSWPVYLPNSNAPRKR